MGEPARQPNKPRRGVVSCPCVRFAEICWRIVLSMSLPTVIRRQLEDSNTVRTNVLVAGRLDGIAAKLRYPRQG